MTQSPGPTRPPWWFRSLFGFVRSLALPQFQAGLAIPEDRIGSLAASVRLGVLPALLLAFLADRFLARMFIAAEDMLAIVVLLLLPETARRELEEIAPPA